MWSVLEPQQSCTVQESPVIIPVISHLALAINGFLGIALQTLPTEQMAFIALNHLLKGKLAIATAALYGLSLHFIVIFIETHC